MLLWLSANVEGPDHVPHNNGILDSSRTPHASFCVYSIAVLSWFHYYLHSFSFNGALALWMQPRVLPPFLIQGLNFSD